MQVSGINSSTNFKGITPIRVYKNGVEVLDRQIVENVSEKAIKAFGGPLENKYKPIAAQLAVRDKDYSYPRAIAGYVNKFRNPDEVNSDFIRVIYDKNNRGYLVTGPMSTDLKVLGHNIGIAKKECAQQGLRTSDKYEQARKLYGEYVKNIGNNMRNRVREAFDSINGEKYGKYQEMRIDITTTPHNKKAKGQITERVMIENISFNDRLMQG